MAISGILAHLILRWSADVSPATKAAPLYVVLVGGGVPLVLSLALELVRREFGSDLLAGISNRRAVHDAEGTRIRGVPGAINGENALTLRASRLAVDSRYARIMNVMRDSEQRRPQLRRLGDQLGAWYTPVALGLAIIAWVWSGQPIRFLAVLVVATPCPLLIGIPVAIIMCSASAVCAT